MFRSSSRSSVGAVHAGGVRDHHRERVVHVMGEDRIAAGHKGVLLQVGSSVSATMR
jgi:hypothetical protein